MLTATQKLTEAAKVYAKHKDQVRREVSSLSASIALMAKYGESRLEDAICREAKVRTCREMK